MTPEPFGPEPAEEGVHDGPAGAFQHVLHWLVREFHCDAAVPPLLRWDRGGGLKFLRVVAEEPFQLVANAAADGYVILTPTAGSARVRIGAGEWDLRPGQALVSGVGDHLDLSASRGGALAFVRIKQAGADNMLRALTRGPLREPLRFAPAMDLSVGPGLTWYRLWSLFAGELERADSYLADPWAADQLERMLLALLLRWHPHTHRAALIEPHEALDRARGGHPRTVRAYPAYVAKVLEIVAAHPEWEHTTGSLARFASISERALQLRFKQHLGVSPMVYLRNTRLDRVHVVLLDSDAADVTLEQLAHRWGFHHYGHFSALYRERFAERPSETLSRSRLTDLVS